MEERNERKSEAEGEEELVSAFQIVMGELPDLPVETIMLKYRFCDWCRCGGEIRLV